MTYLQRIDYRPTRENLTAAENEMIDQHFDAYGAEMILDGQAIRWEHIDEVEVVKAPRASGPAGWFVEKFFLGGQQRYHVGVYFGTGEAIFPNITWNIARYVVENIAFYAPNRITYNGPEDLVPLTEI